MKKSTGKPSEQAGKTKGKKKNKVVAPKLPAQTARPSYLKVVSPSDPPPPVAPANAWKASLIRETVGPKHGQIIPCLANAVSILTHEPEWQGVFAYDEFTEEIVKTRPPPWHADDMPAGELTGPLHDDDAARVAAWLHRDRNEFNVSAHLVEQAIRLIAAKHRIHPVRDWLRSLKWDGKKRLDTWLISLAGADDTPYTRAVSSMFAIAAVARVHRPGCKVDHTLIVEGKTGKGKSTLLRTFMGGQWFVETEVDLGNKDFYQMLRGKWGIELAELDSLSRGDLSRIKAVLTKTVDTYRESYGRHTKNFPRQCVFTGSTEEDNYLKDEKGNRRFWPVKIGKTIDFDKVEQAREQIWAEAVVRFDRGEQWHITDPALLKRFEEEQELRRQVDPWEAPIAEMLRGSRYVDNGISTGEVLGFLEIPLRDQTRMEQMKAAGILKKLGWIRRQLQTDGHREWRYYPEEVLAWRVVRNTSKSSAKKPKK